MKNILLHNGMIATIDDCDYDRVMNISTRWRAFKNKGQHSWYARSQHRTLGENINILMHRLIMDSPSGLLVDHADRNGLNNIRRNLRIANKSQNGANSRLRISNTSGFRGVWKTKHNRFCAEIRVRGIKRALGYFISAEIAARAYDRAALCLFGSFAALNFPKEMETK